MPNAKPPIPAIMRDERVVRAKALRDQARLILQAATSAAKEMRDMADRINPENKEDYMSVVADTINPLLSKLTAAQDAAAKANALVATTQTALTEATAKVSGMQAQVDALQKQVAGLGDQLKNGALDAADIAAVQAAQAALSAK